jgi:hypothetical protein
VTQALAYHSLRQDIHSKNKSKISGNNRRFEAMGTFSNKLTANQSDAIFFVVNNLSSVNINPSWLPWLLGG